MLLEHEVVKRGELESLVLSNGNFNSTDNSLVTRPSKNLLPSVESPRLKAENINASQAQTSIASPSIIVTQRKRRRTSMPPHTVNGNKDEANSDQARGLNNSSAMFKDSQFGGVAALDHSSNFAFSPMVSRATTKFPTLAAINTSI